MRVVYHDKEMPKLEFIGGDRSDWIDVRISDVIINGRLKEFREDGSVKVKKGDFVLIDLGFSLELPSGYEGHLLPRSSTFKNTGLIMTNSMGIIDESYKGDGDHWLMPFFATRDTELCRHERIGQFRIIEKMGYVTFTEVETLCNSNRGGHGSSGTK